MTADAIAFASLCVVLMGALLVFVRDSAIKATAHEYRIQALEGAHSATVVELRKEIEKLEGAVGRLTETVAKLHTRLKVGEVRGSQGQFGDTDRPGEF
jgi:hypothetical protein